MLKQTVAPPTSRSLVVVITVMMLASVACGSNDRTDDLGPPCDCPEFTELVDTINWSDGQGTTTEAAIYMAEPNQAHAIFAVRTTPLDPEDVAADIARNLTNDGLAVSERVRGDGQLVYDVAVVGGELNIWPVPRPTGGGGINFSLRSVPTADALVPYEQALGLVPID